MYYVILCMCIFVYVHIGTYTKVHMHTCAHRYTHLAIFICMLEGIPKSGIELGSTYVVFWKRAFVICVHVYMCICVYGYMCIWVYVYMCTWVYMYMCICVYKCMCIWVYGYMCTYGWRALFQNMISDHVLDLMIDTATSIFRLALIVFCNDPKHVKRYSIKVSFKC